MNAPLHPETRRLLEESAQGELPLATEGVQRHVWQSRFGPMLIEVIDGLAYVNGQAVTPAQLGSAEPAGNDTPAASKGTT